MTNNSYDRDIASRRLVVFVEEYLQRHKSIGSDLVHVMLLGDFIHNETMRGSARSECEYGFGFPQQQLYAAQEIVNIVQALESAGAEVRCYGVVGNHGRVGKPGDNPTANNYDNVVYNHVNAMLGAQSSARVRISDDKYVVAGVCGKTKRIIGTHGDQIGGWGKSVPVREIVNKGFEASDIYGFAQVMAWGHGHRAFSLHAGIRVHIGNPSLCGETPYTGEKLGNARAGQSFFFVSDNRFGVFAYENVDLHHIQRKRR